MILRHVIAYGRQILTTPIPNDIIDREFNNFKAQIQAQGGDTTQLKILTDIELEEGEYTIKEIYENEDNQDREQTNGD